MIGPYLQDSSLPVLAQAVSIAYPLLDLMMLAMAARLAFGGTVVTPALAFLLLSITCQLASDTVLAWTVLHDSFYYGHPMFSGWLASFGFLGAALHPSMRTLAAPGPADATSWRGRLLALGAAGVLAPVVLVWHGLRHHENHLTVLALATAVLTILVFTQVARLVGALRRAETRLTSSETRLDDAQRLAQIGNWTWDMTTGELTWSTELYRILGLDPAEVPPSYETFLQLVHPDDRPRPLEEHGRLARQGKPFRDRCRIIRPDGQERVLDAIGEMVPGEQAARRGCSAPSRMSPTASVPRMAPPGSPRSSSSPVTRSWEWRWTAL